MGKLPSGTRRAFRLAVRRPRIEADVDDEVAFHLEMRVAELVARGLTPEAAQAEACRRFGDTRHWSMAMTAEDRERAALEQRAEWLDDLRQDLRYGVRSLLRAPLFTLLAVLTLALGIGANAAVFGVVKSVLLDALPYADAGRVMRAYGRRVDGSQDRGPVSAGTIMEVAARQRSFSQIASFEGMARDAVYSGDDNPIVTKVAWVEPSLFPTLGVAATRGRVFRAEDAAADTAYNIIVSHATWQRLFAGDPGIVGRAVRVNGIPRTVIGVLPRGFIPPFPGEVDFYFALDFHGVMRDPVRMRRQQNYGLVARLKPGVTVQAAQRDLAAIGKDLAREYPQFNGSVALVAMPVRESMIGDTRKPLLVLLASAALVLMITCANLAGALLSRALTRRREFAVRVALGAARGRIVRQLLTESMALALAGGVAGIVLAVFGLKVLRGLAMRALPPYAELSLDGGALVVTALIALGTGLAFGVMPALTVSRCDPQDSLRDEGRGTSESTRSRRLRGMLVAAQIALCLSLLGGAGLLARSLWAMTATPLGFNPDHVLTVAVQLPSGTYTTNASRSSFVSQFEDRVRALPGVIAVASTGEVPTRVVNHNSIFVDGAPPPPSDAVPLALYTTVSDDYFRTLGIPLKEGRPFGPQDGGNGPPTLIINESLARRFWPNERAVGKRVRLDPSPDAPAFTVIGVVGNERNDPARPDPEITMYMSNRMNPWNGPIFVIRTKGDPLALVKPVQQTLASLDPRLPLHNPVALRALVSEGLAGRRLPVVLMTAFGVLALLLASVGVYAMFAAMAAAREREFGVRMALGSSRGAIARLVLRQGGVWMLAGLAVGAGGVVVVARLVRGLLYGVAPFDPIALGLATLLLIAAAAVALLVPVRRATRVDPIAALR
jgi:putative ABC transport system permease protein